VDYACIYDDLMVRGRGRLRHGYMERHHIVPRCLGGSDRKDNLVYLTAREHFLAHKMLVRMYPEIFGLWTALMLMGRLAGHKSRIFESERIRAAEMRRSFRYSKTSREKMSDSAKARGSVSPATEFKPGLVPWNKGLSPEQSHRYGKKHSEETVARMRTAQQAGRQAQSERMKQWWAGRKARTQVEGALM
jgi:hypothetical protein